MDRPVNAGDELRCYRCGASLAELTPPISRRDHCPGCGVFLHVCRMCTQFRRDVARQCTEDDAEEVLDKEAVNFCEWFEPSAAAFDPARAATATQAEQELAALFGGEDTEQRADPDASAAEDLFK